MTKSLPMKKEIYIFAVFLLMSIFLFVSFFTFNSSSSSEKFNSFSDLVFDSRTFNVTSSPGFAINLFCDSILLNNITPNQKISLIYLIDFANDGKGMQVGGLDYNFKTKSCNGYFNLNSTYWYGLSVGQVINSSNGFWIGWYDLNGDGFYGNYDAKTGLVSYQDGEFISSDNIFINNISYFDNSSGSLTAKEIYINL